MSRHQGNSILAIILSMGATFPALFNARPHRLLASLFGLKEPQFQTKAQLLRFRICFACNITQKRMQATGVYCRTMKDGCFMYPHQSTDRDHHVG